MIVRIFEYIKIFLLLLAVSAVSGVVVMKVAMYTGGETVTTPDVRGKEIIPALEALDRSGLYLKVLRMEYNPAVPKDRIISQAPAPGEPLKTGRDVKVVVSRGSKETVTPDVVGSSLLRAHTVLEHNEIKIRRRIYIHSSSPKDTILAQNPPPGSRVRRGDSLTLLVSSGPYPEYIMTPDFLDEPISTAQERLKKMDLRIRRVSYKPSEEKERGLVIDQDPKYGARVERKSFISLTVSEGEESLAGDKPATYAILYYTIPDGPAPVQVSITQENAGGEKEVYNRIHRPGDTVSLLVEIKGRTAAKIFLDNELAEVRRF